MALARALVIEPSVLLFDEPLSNLDAKLRVTMRTEIRKIQQKVGITAIYVTHDQSEAMSISDKIIIMSKGKVEQIGTPREIYYHPNSRFVADFIGEANFLEARVRSASGEKAVIDVVGQELTVNNFAKAGPGDDAVLVIRPEGATLAEQGLLEGTVTLSTFMGSYQYYQVMVGNMEIQITDYNPVNRRIYEVGEKAYLDFDAKGFTSCRRIGTIGSMRNRMRMKKSWSIYIAVIGMSLCLAGCAGSGTSAAAGHRAGADRAASTEHGAGTDSGAGTEHGAGRDHAGDEELVIYCPHPLEFINPIVAEFEGRTGIRVYVQTGGTGELLKMAEEGSDPPCDIFWGGSLSTTSPKRELFEAYISCNEDMVRDEFKNREGNMSRFTDIPSVIMVNTNLIGDVKVEGYEDLLQPELKGRIAMCDPATSSSAYEHLINMLYAMGDGEPEQGWDYVEDFCRNLDGILLGGSGEVYQGVAQGKYAVGLTFEEAAAHYVADRGPVKLVYMKEGVISTPDSVCIVKGSRHMKEAREFVDFVTGRDAQTVISMRLDRRSVRMDVEEPSYLPDKEDIHIIYSREDEVNSRKGMWLEHFASIYSRVLEEDGGMSGEVGSQ